MGEVLETRCLHTTLFGGDVFEYVTQDPESPTETITTRIVLTGNIVIELVGSDGTGNATDVSGAFLRSEVRGITGGYVPYTASSGTGGSGFMLYIASSDENASIVVGTVEDFDPDDPSATREMQPFEGSAGTLRIRNAASGAMIDLTSPDGIGSVFFGSKTAGNDDSTRNNIPRSTTAIATNAIGVLPAGTYTAGIDSSSKLLNWLSDEGDSVSDSLLGSQVNDVTGLAVLSSGTTYAVDSDAVGSSAAQLVTISSSGKATSTIDITWNGTALTGNLGLTVGPNDSLIAVFSFGGALRIGTIDPTSGAFTQTGTLASSITDVAAMAYHSASGSLYVVDQDGKLQRLNASTGATESTIGTVADSAGGEIEIGSMAFDTSGRLLAQDITNGRVVDISLATAVAGGSVATSKGTMAVTVGAMAYDSVNGRFLVANNMTGVATGRASSGSTSSVIQTFSSSLTTTGNDIGKVYIGGTVTGKVYITGSVGTFYAGWILTGDLGGVAAGSTNATTANFYVGGDLNYLLVLSSIGTGGIADTPSQTTYLTGTVIEVGGRIGTIQVGEDNAATLRAASGQSGTLGDTTLSELELKTIPAGVTDENAYIGGQFQSGNLMADLFNNDSLSTAQRIFAPSNTSGVSSGIVTVSGMLEDTDEGDNDEVDYYAITLMAGQTITFSLANDGADSVRLGVFDADGRLVMTQYSTDDLVYQSIYVTGASPTYSFTADRPGEYVIAVARTSDTGFDGSNGLSPSRVSYQFTLSGLGNTAIGAVVVGGDILNDATSTTYSSASFANSGIYAASGDIGVVWAGGSFVSFESDDVNAVRAANGSIRAIIAGAIGVATSNDPVNGISYAASGNVGLIRSTSGVMRLNQATGTVSSNTGTVANFNPDLTRVGGYIQLIDSAGKALVNLFADGAIGTIRAENMATLTPSLIIANADNSGEDGIIDLIDVAGDLGTLAGGGAVIYTNTSGNVRYMRVGGAVYRDAAFGGGGQDTVTLSPGASLSFTDDSGSVLNVNLGSATTGQISYVPYSVRSGGAVLTKLVLSGIGVTDATAVKLTSSGGGSFEIGVLQVTNSTGTAVSVTNGVFAQSSSGSTVSLEFGGSAVIDVLSLNASATNFTSVTNSTDGELLDFTASSIGTLSYKGDLGISRAGVTGMAVLPRYSSSTGRNDSPFQQQATLIRVGNAMLVSSAKAVGNIVGTNVNTIRANSGNLDDSSIFEGVSAPIVFTGIINQVVTGEGVASAGTGYIGGGVIYAGGAIGSVTGNGDMAGVVASATSIGTISFTGALINATIVAGFTTSQSSGYLGVAPVNNAVFTSFALTNSAGAGTSQTTYEIATIRAQAGIIGSYIGAADIQTIYAGGFGLIYSHLQSQGGGVWGSITVDGYGIRSTVIDVGSSLNTVKLTGTGVALAANSVTSSVRRSEWETTDSTTGLPVSAATDIHVFLGTSAASPVISGVTDTGAIEASKISGNLNLGTLTAVQIRSGKDRTTDETLNTEINFSGTISKLSTTSVINGLTIRTANLKTFSPATDVNGLNLTVSGAIKTLKIKGSLGSGSVIQSIGASASIGSISVAGNFDGELYSQGRVGTIFVGGNVTNGKITVSAPGTTAIKKLTVNGSLSATSFNITGDIGTFSTAGSMGSSGDTFTLAGSIKSLNVGTAKASAVGKELAMNLNVTGSIGSINVNGRVTGSVTASGSISKLTVKTDGAANTDLITAPITSSAGSIQNVTVSGGDIASNISSYGAIKKVSVVSGSIDAGSTISTRAGGIGSVTVKGGKLLGSLTAGDTTLGAKQSIGSITVDSQLGDGTNPLVITASSLGTLKVGSSIFSGTSITIDGNIQQLNVKGSVESGATIQANLIKKLLVSGAINGEIKVIF